MKNKNKNKFCDLRKKTCETTRRIVAVSFLVFAPGYILFTAFLYFNQANFFYYPDDQDFVECEGFVEYERKVFGRTRFYFLDRSEEVIVFYHGNAGSACDRTHWEKILSQSDKSIIVVEYAGYANDHVVPSKDLIFEDVKNVENFIREKNFEKVTLIGERIGSGAASFHASIGSAEEILLVTPFANLEDVAKAHYPIFPISFIIKEDYDNTRALNSYKGKLLIVYGTEDDVIYPRFAEDLYIEVGTENKEKLSIFGAGQSDIFGFEEATDKIKEFIEIEN